MFIGSFQIDLGDQNHIDLHCYTQVLILCHFHFQSHQIPHLYQMGCTSILSVDDITVLSVFKTSIISFDICDRICATN